MNSRLSNIFVLLCLSLSFSNCRESVVENIELERVPRQKMTGEFSEKVRNLGEKISAIDEDAALESLTGEKEQKFLNRVKELKKSYNQLVIELREGEKEAELKVKYNKTKEIFEFLVRNYEV